MLACRSDSLEKMSKDKEAVEAIDLFERALGWLRLEYDSLKFYVERDVVATLQLCLLERIKVTSSSLRVFNDYPILPGQRRALTADLAILGKNNRVLLVAEFKYEPAHYRSGMDIWPSKFSPTVVFWGDEGVKKDLERVRRFVNEKRAAVAYSVFIDEGGFFRSRPAHPGTVWHDWGNGRWTLVSRFEGTETDPKNSVEDTAEESDTGGYAVTAGFSFRQELVPEIRLEQRDPFAQSCLPSTMRLAHQHRKRILKHLDQGTNHLPFEDRVLIWLGSHWGDDVRAFHQSEVPAMMEKFAAHQLSRFDEHYLTELRLRLKSQP